MVLDAETLNDIVKFQVEQEDGKRVKNKPLIENLNVKKKQLIDALCKVSYDDLLSFDKIVSIFIIYLHLSVIQNDLQSKCLRRD